MGESWLQKFRNESHSHHFQLQCNVLLHQIFNAFCLMMMELIDNSTHAPLSVDMSNRNAQWKERLFTFHSWHTLALKQVVPNHQTFLCCHALKIRPWPDGESHSILWVSRSLESICKNRWNLRLVLLFLNVGQITTRYLKVIILIWHWKRFSITFIPACVPGGNESNESFPGLRLLWPNKSFPSCRSSIMQVHSDQLRWWYWFSFQCGWWYTQWHHSKPSITLHITKGPELFGSTI